MEASGVKGTLADRAIVWRDDRLELLDQRLLPGLETYLACDSVSEVADAIRIMVVRGAPAIGITAAYGVVLAARSRFAEAPDGWRDRLEQDLRMLSAARPTAVNLVWALDRMRKAAAALGDRNPGLPLLEEAMRIHEEDRAANHRMGEFGAALIKPGSTVITHCNAGALATGGYGTALGVIRSGCRSGKIALVYADETRPWLQGSRLTAWELLQDEIAVTLIADSAAASLMAQQRVDWVVVGADRIAANGDVANKIGTYNLALAAGHHGVRVMVVAPTSTIDMGVDSGDKIPIEQRDPDELLDCGGSRIAAAGARAWNPVFDVTPASMVDVIVTERGVVREPNQEKMEKLTETCVETEFKPI